MNLNLDRLNRLNEKLNNVSNIFFTNKLSLNNNYIPYNYYFPKFRPQPKQ